MTIKIIEKKKTLRLKRKLRIRDNVFGTMEKPRITIFRSNKYLYAQAIDDISGTTITSINGKKEGLNSNKDAAVLLGKKFAELLKAKGITEGIFDRNGYLYHGVVAAFAQALRDNGVSL